MIPPLAFILYLFSFTTVLINTYFANTVIIEFPTYEEGAKTNHKVEVTAEEAKKLKKIYSGLFTHIEYSGSCGFGKDITFLSDKKIVKISIAGDGCGGFEMEGFQYTIEMNRKNYEATKEIFKKYGAYWAYEDF